MISRQAIQVFSPSLFPEDLDHVLAHTRDDWEELRGRRLFITGGTGFFGMWLLESFAWANCRLNLQAEAVVLTRNPEQFAGKAPHLTAERSLRIHRGDVRDFQFPGGEFPFVIHAAAPVNVAMNRDEPLAMLDIVAAGTRRVLDFAIGHTTRKFLVISSGAVYGRQPSNITHLPEEYAGGPETTSPVAAYAEGKRLAELLAAIYSRQHSMEVKIARCFAFVGPYLPLDGNYAIGNFVRDALNGGPVIVRGDGTPRRSYLYAADLAIWLWTVLFRGSSCRPYNVGSDVDLSIESLARCVGETVAGTVPISLACEAAQGQLSERYVPQITRAQRELGLAVLVPLAEGIRRTAAFVRRQSGKETVQQ